MDLDSIYLHSVCDQPKIQVVYFKYYYALKVAVIDNGRSIMSTHPREVLKKFMENELKTIRLSSSSV